MYNCHWVQLQLVMFSLWSIRCDSGSNQSAYRVKRIVFGADLSDYRSGYAVTKYFTWLGRSHACGYWESFKFSLQPSTKYFTECSVSSGSVLCGGALLSPRIIQTACHCLGRVSEVEKPHQVLRRFIVQDGNVDTVVAFVGSTATEDMKTGYISQKFIIHEKCAQIGRTEEASHDYGIILLRTSVEDANDPKFASKSINFTPVYSLQALSYIWNKLITQEPVCLFVGYGYYLDIEGDTTAPSVLQHYWGVIRNRRKCYDWSARRFEESDDATWDGHTRLNFSNYATWYCSTPIAGKKGRTGSGDSGSPVTCNNEFVGLVSGAHSNFKFPVLGYSHEMIATDLTKAFAIVFAEWQNAAEYRQSFLKHTLGLE